MKGRPYGKKSKTERVAERKEKFLLGGIEIFGANGYHKARIKDICKQAELTERYFYENFKNKEELYCSCYREVGNDLYQSLQKKANLFSPNESKRLTEHLVLAYVQWCFDNQNKTKILLFQVKGIDKEIDNLSQETISVFVALLSEVTAFELNESNLDEDDKNILVNSMARLMIETVKYWMTVCPTISVFVVAKNLIFIIDSIRFNLPGKK